jgi:hypothetical protein
MNIIEKIQEKISEFIGSIVLKKEGEDEDE